VVDPMTKAADAAVPKGAHHEKTEIFVPDKPTQNLLWPPLDEACLRRDPGRLEQRLCIVQPLLRRRRVRSPTVTTVTDRPANNGLRAI
jgi:hypothetical protein